MLKQELTTSKQIEEQKYKRECKGRSLALTRNVYRLVNTDVFYVESESSNDIYYFVKFKPDAIEWCSCPDNSTRHKKCKHLFAIEFAIKRGTIKEIDKLPITITEADIKEDTIQVAPILKSSSSYKDDDYSL
jgi:predicted nucleic acid-binding Zn finger protein